MPDVTRLSALAINKLYSKRLAITAEASRALVKVGRGDERIAETHAAAAAGDKLALTFVAADVAFRIVAHELDERRRYHGSDAPIRRRA